MQMLASDHPTAQHAKLAIDAVLRVRERRPRIHCITNAVAQNFTANLLLAAGAIPSMTVAPDEIADFVASADALLVNLGTFDRERREAVEIAVKQVVNAGRPWVLDPVFICFVTLQPGITPVMLSNKFFFAARCYIYRRNCRGEC